MPSVQLCCLGESCWPGYLYRACLRAMQARAGTVYAPGLNYAPQPLPARTPGRPPMDGMAAPESFGAQARLRSFCSWVRNVGMSAGLPVSPPTQLKLLCLCLVLVGWVRMGRCRRRSLHLLQAP